MIKVLLSQYPTESAYLQNENNFISALKNHIVRLENEILFKKKEFETKNHIVQVTMARILCSCVWIC